jgi:lauroyl/myristoyl acyltransferase
MREHFLDKPFWYLQALKTVQSLPTPITYGLARLVAALAFFFSTRDRRHVSRNLDVIFNGYKPPSGQRLLLWRFFQNYGIYIADFFRLLSMNLEESRAFARLYEGRHHLDEALAKGRGAVLLTAHIGHWEIGGLGLRAMGYPVNVVAIKHNTLFTNTLVNVMRARHGIRIIEVEESTFGAIELVKALDRNELVAVLGDKPFSERSEATTFFGRPVQLPVGPVLLAMAARAPIIPAFSVMEAPGRYRGIIEPPLELHYGPDRSEALQHNLLQVARVFERYIRLYPDQWYVVEPIEQLE